MIYNTKTTTTTMFLVLIAASTTSAFSLTAMLTRAATAKTAAPAPSQALLDFNAQMAAIVAEERQEHYYPYVRQTTAFLPLDDSSEVLGEDDTA